MAVGQVTLPAQGTGSTTPQVAVDVIAGKNYEYIKLVDGTADSVVPVPSTVPADASSATRPGLWVNDQLMLWNGTTWDRARGTIANGLLVDVSRITGTVTTSGTTTISGAIPAGTNNIGDVDVLTLPAIALAASAANIGDVDVLTLPSLPAGGNAIGTVGVTSLPAVAPGVPATDVNGRVTRTDTTAADVIAAQAASRTVVTSIVVVNGSATVDTKVEILDGATVKLQGFAAKAGGGWSASGAPLLIGTTNTALRARCATTGADVDVFVGGYRT